MQHFEKHCFWSYKFVLGVVFLTYYFISLILTEIQQEKERERRKSKVCEISRRQEVLQIQNITMLKTTEGIKKKIEFAHQNIKIK